MIVLDSTTDTLEIDLNAAHTTNALAFFASWRDVTTTTYTPGNSFGTTNGTTDVVMVSAPAASTQRIIDFIQVNNRDTVAHTVTIRFVDNVTEYNVYTAVMSSGDMLQYQDGAGWTMFSNNGSIKMAIVQGSSSASSALSIVTTTADVINNNAVANTIADVTGLSFPVTAGQRYWFRFTIPYSSAATTTGSRWSISGPAAPTSLNYTSQYTITATSAATNYATAYDVPAGATATSLTAGNVAIIEGVILPSANGNVIARFASEVASSAVTALRGAMVQYVAVG